MKIVVSPNPYRDKQFKHARQACQILKEAGAEVSLCLPFDVDRSFEIPSDLRFREIQKEIRTADMLICFGGDGTILHSSKIATEHGLPILGVNIGTMGFIAELEASEMELLRKIPQGDYTVEPRTMLDVSVVSGKQTLFHDSKKEMLCKTATKSPIWCEQCRMGLLLLPEIFLHEGIEEGLCLGEFLLQDGFGLVYLLDKVGELGL